MSGDFWGNATCVSRLCRVFFDEVQNIDRSSPAFLDEGLASSFQSSMDCRERGGSPALVKQGSAYASVDGVGRRPRLPMRERPRTRRLAAGRRVVGACSLLMSMYYTLSCSLRSKQFFHTCKLHQDK